MKEKTVEIAAGTDGNILFQVKKKSAYTVRIKSVVLVETEQVEIPEF